jgi:hypothetical protein
VLLKRFFTRPRTPAPAPAAERAPAGYHDPPGVPVAS